MRSLLLALSVLLDPKFALLARLGPEVLRDCGGDGGQLIEGWRAKGPLRSGL